MSITFPLEESDTTLDRLRARQDPDVTRVTSPARVEANRRNARKSTGPKTVQGKRRSSGNAMKHGLCRTLSCLPTECEATFLTFVEELREEFRPATALQRLTFNQIASLTWRLERLPEAQTKIFEQELGKVQAEEGEELSPSDVLARRFSEAPSGNGFALMERYERGMRSQLLRLMRHYQDLGRRRPTTPHDPGEPPCPREGSKPAWTDQDAQAQRAWFDEQERLASEGKQPDPKFVKVREIQQKQKQEQEKKQEQMQQEAEEERAHGQERNGLPERGPHWDGPKRSQSKPREKCDSEPPAGKCVVADTAPVTERTQGDRIADGTGIGRSNASV